MCQAMAYSLANDKYEFKNYLCLYASSDYGIRNNRATTTTKAQL